MQRQDDLTCSSGFLDTQDERKIADIEVGEACSSFFPKTCRSAISPSAVSLKLTGEIVPRIGGVLPENAHFRCHEFLQVAVTTCRVKPMYMPPGRKAIYLCERPIHLFRRTEEILPKIATKTTTPVLYYM